MENKTHEQFMMETQYRKSRSIAFFNATNSAIAFHEQFMKYNQDAPSDDQVKDFITKWRDWFLAEYDRDYKENVATIGMSANVLKGLDKAKKSYESK